MGLFTFGGGHVSFSLLVNQQTIGKATLHNDLKQHTSESGPCRQAGTGVEPRDIGEVNRELKDLHPTVGKVG